MRTVRPSLVLIGSLMLLACSIAQAQQVGEPESASPRSDAKENRAIHGDLPPPEEAETPHEEAHRVWARADFWLAWIKDGNYPPLVTVGATSQPRPGAIGQDGTMIRFGGNVKTHEREGASFRLGGWLDCDECFGLELGYWFLGSRNASYEQSSPGAPAIARPFFDVNAMRQDASLVSFPGLASGSVAVSSGTSLYGADANFVWKLNQSEDYPLRLLGGFRFLNLHDDLTINESVQVDSNSPVFAGQHINVQDLFDCNNYFYGANIGVCAGYIVRSFEFQVTAQCALGVTQECVGIAGWTNFTGAGVDKTVPAGLLALGTNIGNHARDAFAVVPQVDFDARFEVTRHIVVSAGWSFLYWSRVARAGNQVNLSLNPDLIPTSANYGQPIVNQQPRPFVSDTDFWLYAAHVGLELRF